MCRSCSPRGAIAAQHPEVVPSLRAGPLRIVNNGHTIQVNTPSGGHTMLGDKRFDLLQFHFHHPSEHVVAGSAFPLEVHLVHRAADGELAVLGVFFRPGAANPALAPVWAALPGSKGPEVVGTAMVDPAALLPGGKLRAGWQLAPGKKELGASNWLQLAAIWLAAGWLVVGWPLRAAAVWRVVVGRGWGS